jgi:hypothetical protein
MTSTNTLTAPTGRTTGRSAAGSHVWRTGAVAGLAASLATSAVAALAHTLGVSLKIAGEAIPPGVATKLTLALTHIVATAIVIPALASRLTD